jgi:hypothetical protein
MEAGMITDQQITDYLSERASDLVPNFIMQKEIFKKPIKNSDYINAYNRMKQSKWYRELADDQLDNGSWGAFHGGSTKARKGHRFGGTEPALRRARELSLTKDDPIIAKCIKIMERYVSREEPYPDPVEKHKDKGKGHYFTIPFGVAANINMFDPDNPVVKPYRDIVVDNIRAAFVNGHFDVEVFQQAVREYRVPGILQPGNAFCSMLICNTNCMDDTLQRQYLDYVWNKKGGIMYISNYPITAERNEENDCRNVEAIKLTVEDKGFHGWFAILENLSGFSLFPEILKDNVIPHLLKEADRLIHGDVRFPTPPSGHGTTCSHHVYGKYAESWRDQEKRKTDMVLRIARILAKC